MGSAAPQVCDKHQEFLDPRGVISHAGEQDGEHCNHNQGIFGGTGPLVIGKKVQGLGFCVIQEHAGVTFGSKDMKTWLPVS